MIGVGLVGLAVERGGFVGSKQEGEHDRGEE